MPKRALVLGGGGARGAVQAGVLVGLYEAGLRSPDTIVGVSVGALNGAAIAAFPSLAGAQMLRRVWLGDLVRDVFRRHSLGMLLARVRGRKNLMPATAVQRLIERVLGLTGCFNFEDQRLPLAVLATDLQAGKRVVFRSGPLAPALLASTAIPGYYPAVSIQGRSYLDGGIVDNAPISVAVEDGAREVLAVALMGGAETLKPPSNWGELIARTLQLSLHQRMLSDFERLRDRARIAVLCPVSAVDPDRAISGGALESLMESARSATAAFLARNGQHLFKRSAVHYLDLGS